MLEIFNFFIYLILFVLFFINLFYYCLVFINVKKTFYLYILIPFDFLLTIFLTFSITLFYYFSFFNYNIVLLTSTSYQDFFYKLFVFWSTQEGSSFFWYLLFNIFTILLIFLNNFFLQFKLGFFNLLTVLKSFFYFYFFLFSNCFLVSNFRFIEGYELNSILQNPLMSIHPPILYIGYLLSIILFIFNLYTYIYISFKTNYLVFFNLVNLFSFFFLWLGICLGSFWAYNELGWGGCWSWDPIENISLIPLLLLIISFHLLILYKKERNVGHLFFLFLYLQCFCFLSCIFGTFFLRSGLISSIHNFIIDYSRGFVLLLFYTLLLFVVFLFYNSIIAKNYKKFTLSLLNKGYFFPKNFFLLITLVTLFIYFFFVFWFTYFSFFIKIFTLTDNVFFDYYFYTSIAFCFLFFLSHFFFYYFCYFKRSLLFINIFFLFEIFCFIFCIDIFFIIIIFLVFSFACYSFVTLKSKNNSVLLINLIHYTVLLLIFLFIFSEYKTANLFLSFTTGDFVQFQGVFIFFDKSFILENFYKSTINSIVYNFLILSSDFSSVLGESLIDKSFILNSKTLRLKSEVLSNLLYDFHFILSNSGDLDSSFVFLKVIIKPFYFLIWLCCYFLFFLVFLLFKQKAVFFFTR